MSFSDLLHSVWEFLSSSTLLQMALFCSFLWLSNIPLYTLSIVFFIHSSVNGHLGCFHVLAMINSHLHHFSRFYTYVLIYNICFLLFLTYITPYNTLGPSISLQITQFWSFYGWVIFHCIHVPQLCYLFICQWTFRLLPCPSYSKECCNEHWSTFVF